MKTKILLRALSLFLVLCSIISIFPVSAFATHEHGSDHCIDENCNTCDLPLVGEGITVALLDSGVQSYPVHTAVDFVGAEEVSSHGDEMAEVLLENAPGVTLLDVRVLNAEGIGVHSKVSEGILWATNHGAQIIVMSFAGLENSRILKEAVEYAAEMGVVMVAAAGNDMKNTATFPAAYAQVLSVGALDAQGGIALGSNSGAYVDLYVEAEGGTSHAAQVVAANIAKLMQERPKVTAAEIYNELSTLVYKSDLLVEQSEDGMVYASACWFHKWGSWSPTRSATCTSAGQRVRYCSKCGKADYDTIKKLGHSASSSYTTTKQATCTSSGTKVKYCTRCSSVCESATISALGHSASGSYTTTREATCTLDGIKVKYCVRCTYAFEYKLITKLGHSQNGYPSVTVQATCTSKGYCTYRCRRCSIDMSTLYTPAKGHSWGPYSVTRPATCGATGEKRRACTQCRIYDYSVTIPPLGHSKSSLPSVTVNETCTTPGYSTYNCVRCKITMEKILIPPLGHSWSDYYLLTKEPKCNEEGEMVRICFNCPASEATPLSKGDHNLSDYEIVLEPTCGEKGTEAQYCDQCGGYYNEREVPETGEHVETERIVLKKETCKVKGKAQEVCVNCNQTVKEELIPECPDKHVDKYWNFDAKSLKFHCDECSEDVEYEEAYKIVSSEKHGELFKISGEHKNDALYVNNTMASKVITYNGEYVVVTYIPSVTMGEDLHPNVMTQNIYYSSINPVDFLNFIVATDAFKWQVEQRLEAKGVSSNNIVEWAMECEECSDEIKRWLGSEEVAKCRPNDLWFEILQKNDKLALSILSKIPIVGDVVSEVTDNGGIVSDFISLVNEIVCAVRNDGYNDTPDEQNWGTFQLSVEVRETVRVLYKLFPQYSYRWHKVGLTNFVSYSVKLHFGDGAEIEWYVQDKSKYLPLKADKSDALINKVTEQSVGGAGKIVISTIESIAIDMNVVNDMIKEGSRGSLREPIEMSQTNSESISLLKFSTVCGGMYRDGIRWP